MGRDEPRLVTGFFFDRRVPSRHDSRVLILCCGPDSFRALARAKELEFAFRQKHDPEGRAIERLGFGKEGVDDVIEKAAGASLFSPKRFLRADGIISSCPKAKQKALIEALSRDVESMIVVSIEEEMPSSVQLKPFEALPKFVMSEYSPLRGKAFSDWAKEYAKSLENIDQKSLDTLIDRYEGDSWSFVNEAIKLSAGSVLEQQERVLDTSPYDVADRFIRADASRLELLNNEFGFSEISIILQQTISALRVRDKDLGGIPLFVSRKLQGMKMSEPEALLAITLEMLFLQRSGFVDEQESTMLFR